jgi:8-oxo-dGTP diphosphatase
MTCVRVAVGIIRKGNAVFIAKRNKNQHQGDKWEFPGGKIEANETTYSALFRELDEEIGIQIINARPFCEIMFDYHDKSVLLDVLEVTAFEGEPYGREGQDTAWIEISALVEDEFPKANSRIIQLLLTESGRLLKN